jgi:hypothetical protein
MRTGVENDSRRMVRRLLLVTASALLATGLTAGVASARWVDGESASSGYVQQRQTANSPNLTLMYAGNDTTPLEGQAFTGAVATWVGAASILGGTYVGLETDNGVLCRAWVLGASGEGMRSLGPATMPGQYWYPSGSQYQSTPTALFQWQIPAGSQGSTLYVECTPLILAPVAETYDGQPVPYATELSKVCGSWMEGNCLIGNDFRASWVIARG